MIDKDRPAAAINRRIAAHAPAVLAFVVLTILQLWPLMLAFTEAVPSDLGDPLLSTWTLWWNAHVVPFTSTWWDGLAFFPAADTLTFSDHRVGLGLIASPIIWLGGSALVAYNVTFALTFLFSAAAGYALAFMLTKSRGAAFVGGLVFGFHPFRAEHLSHLELLAAYWLPIGLLALHRWAQIPRARWLVLFIFALTMQALTCGYYFVYFAPLLGLWLLWFTPRRLSVPHYAGLIAALAIPLLLTAPILLKYRAAHAEYGFARSIVEIELLSADLVGLLTAPGPLALWNTPDAWRRPEGSLFPGLAAVALIVLALAVSRRRARWQSASAALVILRWVFITGAALAAVAALVPVVGDPVAFQIGPLGLSVSDFHKPLSVATVLFTAWVLTSARIRLSWREQSPFAFYVLATLAMWLFALGPTPRLLGEQVLYKPPYSWLMVLPSFRDGFRAPARFAMLAALSLSVAAALAFWRLTRTHPARVRQIALGVVAVGIALDGWIAPFHVVTAPPPLLMPTEVPRDAAVFELPIGVFEDASTMYHSTFHGRHILNGISGYEPAHYPMLRLSLDEDRVEVVTEFARYSDIAVFVPRDERGRKLLTLLYERIPAKSIAATETHDVLLLPRQPHESSRTRFAGSQVRPVSISSAANSEHLALMVDDNWLTTWVTPEAQRGGEQLVADLGAVIAASGVTLSLGRSMTAFPRGLVVEVSPDGANWIETWRGDAAALSVAAAIQDPRDVTTVFSFAPQPTRYIRLTQTGRSAHPWAVAEFRVLTDRR